jgi:WD40 repeat protein
MIRRLPLYAAIVLIATAAAAQAPKVRISEDKQTIVMDHGGGKNSPVLRLEEIRHKKSAVAPDFYLEAKEFRSAEISPDGKTIAFSITGNTHDWVGLFTFTSKNSQDVDILFSGTVGSLTWSADNNYVAVDTVPASGLRSIRLIDVANAKLVGSVAALAHLGHEVETYSPQWDKNTLLFIQKPADTGTEKTGQYTIPTKR